MRRSKRALGMTPGVATIEAVKCFSIGDRTVIIAGVYVVGMSGETESGTRQKDAAILNDTKAGATRMLLPLLS